MLKVGGVNPEKCEFKWGGNSVGKSGKPFSFAALQTLSEEVQEVGFLVFCWPL